MNTQSIGVTETERLLAQFCDKSFLRLWSYPNPYKDDGHELCDLLAVFDNHVFIFFDRENHLPDTPDKDPMVVWNRWKRSVIDRQTKTAHGAERYIRSGRSVFLDAKLSQAFPLAIDPAKAIIHKIVVAHGAKEACERASPDNVYGSLAITYTDDSDAFSRPFHVGIDRTNPVHIFDSHNMPIVLGELDTVSDFSAYLDEKVRTVNRFRYLSYCGEEDLLAHYLATYDQSEKRHIIGPQKAGFDGVMIGEGEWHDFVRSAVYKHTKDANQISYFWDDLIQRTCRNSLAGLLGGNSNIYAGQSAIYEMVKEPRFMRRGIAERMLSAVERFPEGAGEFSRQVTFLPSIQADVGYVLMQLRAPASYRAETDYRDKRRDVLETACGAAKNKFTNLVKVIGIGIDAPKFSDGTNAEDFILLPCETWTSETKEHYQERNKDWNFFETENLRQHNDRVTRFVQPPRTRAKNAEKVGRNAPCPCGSGAKYKRCCLGR
ncbi:SEC-C metal-binding domain-containing protein [Tardiphaga sp. 866_E4_N2_1]|uniref:YecA family protein n=1 Tax=unclassified Tardiphaga TaxID=2631404 RepID=UPI003F213427